METDAKIKENSDKGQESQNIWQDEYKKATRYYVSLFNKCDNVFFARIDQANAGYQIQQKPVLKNIIWHYANPIAWMFIHPSFGSVLMCLLVIISVTFWFLEWPIIAYAASIYNNSNILNFSHPIPSTTIIPFILVLLFLPAGYIKIIYFWSNKYFPILLKIFYSCFIIVVIFVIPNLLLRGITVDKNVFFHTFWFQNKTSCILLIAFIIPSIIFTMLSILDLCTFLVEKMRLFLPTFRLLIDSVSTNGMDEIIQSVITTNNEEWKIQDLSLAELSTIKELAKSNLESSEKKTTPWLLLLAILGVFSGANFFTGLINPIEATISSWVHPEIYIETSFMGIISFLINSILFMVLYMSLLLFLIIVFGLIKNIFIQSQIIDLCITSKYALPETIYKHTQIKSREPNLVRRIILAILNQED
jgi:hypothetical protein